MSKVGVFLPCRSGSERVKNKNTRRFCQFEFGLLELKLTQLQNSENISKVYISTNDVQIIEWFSKQSSRFPNCVLDIRPTELCLSSTPTFDLAAYSREVVKEEIVLWTHVTSPFFNENMYNEAIDAFFESNQYDSLVAYYPVKKFLWDRLGPRNYNPNILGIWPNTQNIPELYEINSAAFIYPRGMSHKWGRIGSNPYFFPCDWLSSFDIDTEEDFFIAEKLFLQ